MSTARRSRRWYALFVAPSFIALAAVLAAIAAGFSPHHLWPVAGFLMVWAGSAGYDIFARRALRRRTYRLRQSPVPRGVRLSKPLWIRLDYALTMIGLVAALGTVVAAIGFPQVAVGILLVLGGMFSISGAFGFFAVEGLTFEDAGLRFHIGTGACLVPWTSIRGVEPIGPDHFQMMRLGIDDLDGVRDAVSPDSPRNRKLAQRVFGMPKSTRGEILLEPWTAGLDGQTLARAIREGMAGRPDPAN